MNTIAVITLAISDTDTNYNVILVYLQYGNTTYYINYRRTKD